MWKATRMVTFPSFFLQVFGDYYHFRHNAVEKRAATSHRDVHIKLQEEPKVRLVLATHRLQQSAPQIGLATKCLFYKQKHLSLLNSVGFLVKASPFICLPGLIPGKQIAANVE